MIGEPVLAALPEIVRDIGAYAGFAAVLGLAVLAALYFSQARDVRRLREWAGRAPERAAVPTVAPVPKRTAPVPAAQKAAATQPAAPAPTARSVPAPVPVGAGARAPATASAAPAAAPSAAPPTGPAPDGTAAPLPIPAPARKPAAPTTQPPGPRPGTPPRRLPPRGPILPPAQVRRLPWYRRIALPAPRYLALVIAGVLVVGGGAAYGVSELVRDEPAKQSGADGGGAAGTREINPSAVTVSVLNGTTVPGLAAQIGDKLEQVGFQRGNVANATEQERAESAVLFAAGSNREARFVARRLRISQIEPVDPESQALAGNASVVVIVGADQTQ